MREDKSRKDNSKKAPDTEQGQPTPPGAAPVTIHAQYIRDLSFENPNAPESLRAGQGAPEMDINIGLDAREIESDKINNLYEVVLNLQATARRGENGPVFVAELQYGVTVSIHDNVPPENHHPILLIEIPRIAFPFARQIMADITINGGFPPLMLSPVDFQALYADRFKEEIEKARNGFEEEQQTKSTDARK